ncbi:MAG: ABC transporter permease [Acidobacteriota bacterium]
MNSPLSTVIRPRSGFVPLDITEVWRYRDLLYFLVWRDIKVRYKQTLLGAAWAVLQPLTTMVVFFFVFRLVAGVESDGVPYQVFAFAGLVPWTFFATGLSMSANSLVGSQNLIKKVYFPRIVIPLATVLAGLVDLVIAFVVLLGLMLAFDVRPTSAVVWLPAFLLLALVTALGVGLWLSALNVQFRDVRYTIPFLTQLWLFATPVGYSTQDAAAKLVEPWSTLYSLNPMLGVVEGFRWALLGTETRPGPMVWLSAVAAFAVLVSGAYVFRRMEKSFADLV